MERDPSTTGRNFEAVDSEDSETAKKKKKKPYGVEWTNKQLSGHEQPLQKDAPDLPKQILNDFFKQSGREKASERPSKHESGAEDQQEIEEALPDRLTPGEAREVTKSLAEADRQTATEELQAAEPGSEQEAAARAEAVLLENVIVNLQNGEQIAEQAVTQAFEDAARYVHEGQDADFVAEAQSATDEEHGMHISGAGEVDYGLSTSKAEGAADIGRREIHADVPPPSINDGIDPEARRYTENPESAGESHGGHQPEPPTSERSPGPRSSYETQKTARDLLLAGGLANYFLLRRRWVNRAERKLEPKRKKIEKEIKYIQNNLKQKETRIRGLAVEQRSLSNRVTVTESTAQSYAAKAHTPERNSSRAPEAIRQAKSEATPESRSSGYWSRTEAPQQIGRIIVEKSPPSLSEKRASETADALVGKKLLEAGEHVIVEGVSMRRLYESNLISEHGLKRLVAEYNRGGDVKAALKHELIERQIDFERDPRLRDKGIAWVGSTQSGATKTKDSSTTPGKGNARTHGSDGKTVATQSSQTANSIITSRTKHQRLMLATEGVIILLLAVVIYLLLR